MPRRYRATAQRYGIPLEGPLATLALEHALRHMRKGLRFELISINDEPAVEFGGAAYLLPERTENPIGFVNSWIRQTVERERPDLLATFEPLTE
jgi:hypothetical protein